MRILIANDQHWPMVSGPATAVRTLAQGLANLGHTVMVVAPSQTGGRYKEKDGNYSITRVRSLPLPYRKNLRIATTYDREIRGIIEDFKPDIIHVHTQLIVGLSTVAAAKKLNIPFVATNHLMPDNLINNVRLLKPVRKPTTYIINEYGLTLFKGARRIIVPTESVIKMFEDGHVDAPIISISNGVDLKKFSPRKPKAYIYEKYGIPTDKKIVLWLGRLDNEKHLEVTVKAFAKLLENHDDIHLVMTGTGNAESGLIDMVNEFEIVDSVTFTGLVPEEDKYEIHRTASVFAVASPNELMCLSMMESMACGKPIVAVDAGALGELVHHDESGYLVTVDDVDGMSRALGMILDNDERREKFGKRARQIAAEHDVKKVMPRFVSLYEKVLAEANDGAAPIERKGIRGIFGRHS